MLSPPLRLPKWLMLLYANAHRLLRAGIPCWSIGGCKTFPLMCLHASSAGGLQALGWYSWHCAGPPTPVLLRRTAPCTQLLSSVSLQTVHSCPVPLFSETLPQRTAPGFKINILIDPLLGNACLLVCLGGMTSSPSLFKHNKPWEEEWNSDSRGCMISSNMLRNISTPDTTSTLIIPSSPPYMKLKLLTK